MKRTKSEETASWNSNRLFRFFGRDALISDLDEISIEEFIIWAHTERGNAPSTIGRTLRDLKAALNLFKIDTSWLKTTDDRIAELLGVPKNVRQTYRPSDEDVRSFLLEAMTIPSIWRWSLIALGTGCRPQAAIDLGPGQVQLEEGLAHLNPKGRRQNKKYRPEVYLPPFLLREVRGWAAVHEGEWGPQYVGYSSYYGLRSTFRRVAERAGIEKMTPYSFRHKVATEMRERGVDLEIREFQLGHRRPGGSSSDSYGEISKRFLSPAPDAIQEWMESLDIDFELAHSLHNVPSAVSRSGRNTGAGDEIRTHDPNLGKVVLYP